MKGVDREYIYAPFSLAACGVVVRSPVLQLRCCLVLKLYNGPFFRLNVRGR